MRAVGLPCNQKGHSTLSRGSFTAQGPPDGGGCGVHRGDEGLQPRDHVGWWLHLSEIGDWRLYLEELIAPGARIAYIADPLNVHRRHAESVTHALNADKHVAEIAQCHELGAARLKLPAKVRSLQTKYRRSVEDQLKAAPPQSGGAKPVVSALLSKRIAEHPVQGDIEAIAFYLPSYIPSRKTICGVGFRNLTNYIASSPTGNRWIQTPIAPSIVKSPLS